MSEVLTARSFKGICARNGRTVCGDDCSGSLCAADGKGKNGQYIGKFVRVVMGVDSYNQTASDDVMHTIHHHDGLDNQPKVAISIGFKAGQSANGGIGAEEEVCPTQSHQPSALEPTVAIGCDRRNQSGADEVQPALQSTVSDGGSTVAVGINSPQPHSTTRGFGNEVQPTFGAAAGEIGNNKPMVALHHIVRRLTVVECSRLQGFPDWWVRIPVDKWRKIDEDERDYLSGLGPWYRSHIRETGKPGVWETDLSSDSPAYKALGNSWATNCAEWILRRIVAAIRLDMI